MTVCALLLAGGASSRMGGVDKLVEPVRGVPLLRDRALACLASGADAVRVVLPPDRPARVAALAGLGVEVVFNDGSALGLSHSLRRGMGDLGADAVLLVLADLPDLTAEHLARVIVAAEAQPSTPILRGATEAGQPGHPVLIRKPLFDALAGLTGDEGAAPLLKARRGDTALVPLEGDAALNDLDTQEDWARWRDR